MKSQEAQPGACQALVVESPRWAQPGQFSPDLQSHSPTMGQKDGEKWTAAVNLQPTISKSDRLPSQRPGSFCQIVKRINSGEAFGCALAEFLDETKLMNADALKLAMEIDPGKLDPSNPGYESWQDAYLAAAAEHLARCAGIAIPTWTEHSDRFLARAWFDNHHLNSLNAMMVAESPLAFRRRFIFTEANPLRRA